MCVQMSMISHPFNGSNNSDSKEYSISFNFLEVGERESVAGVK